MINNHLKLGTRIKRSGLQSKTYVWHAGLLHKLKSYGISGWVFGLIFSFLSNRRLRVVLDGKSSQEYSINAGVRQRFILGPTLFLLYINDLPDVICNVAIYAGDTNLYSKLDQASDLWQQLELASATESDLQHCGLGQEVSCWFQCWKNSTGFISLV